MIIREDGFNHGMKVKITHKVFDKGKLNIMEEIRKKRLTAIFSMN